MSSNTYTNVIEFAFLGVKTNVAQQTALQFPDATHLDWSSMNKSENQTLFWIE